MRRKYYIFSFLAVVIFLAASFTNPSETRQEKLLRVFHTYLEKHSVDMLASLDTFNRAVSATQGRDSLQLQNLKSLFLDLRIAYKKLEPFSCYYFLASERNFNGPVVPEIEDESEPHPKIEWPHGLQQIEEYLYGDNVAHQKQKILDELALMHENLSAMRIAFQTLSTDEVKFIEAIQLQVIRTFTLGISQFDTPESKNSIGEAVVTFEKLLDIFSAVYQDDENKYATGVLKELEHCRYFFSRLPAPDNMDFLDCFRNYYYPLSRALALFRKNAVENNYYPSSALQFSSPSVFQSDAFNRFFYNPRGTDPAFSSEAAALGKALFFDPVLSENNRRACASCHQPERAFTDGMKTSSGFLEGEMLTRNAPTLINAALQRNYFFDMRADHLEGQIGHVLSNKNEMQSSFEAAIQKLNTSAEYVAWFKKAFQGKEDTVISKTSIENAISEYERTLISLNSKLDRNIRGEEKTFTSEEREGFDVFMNKGRCATCHYLPLFNNVVPPQYTRSEFEVIGTTATADFTKPAPDRDPGRGGLYGTEIFMHAFKTPSLRNISLTAPYMHNGAFQTLEQVVDFYNKGGGAGLGLSIPNQTLPADSLQLTANEKKSLVLFLNTLTDTVHLTSKPVRLPNLEDAVMNKRKSGGEY